MNELNVIILNIYIFSCYNMILSGLSHVREYLGNLATTGNPKVKIMWHPSLCIVKRCIEFVLFLNFFYCIWIVLNLIFTGGPIIFLGRGSHKRLCQSWSQALYDNKIKYNRLNIFCSRCGAPRSAGPVAFATFATMLIRHCPPVYLLMHDKDWVASN